MKRYTALLCLVLSLVLLPTVAAQQETREISREEAVSAIENASQDVAVLRQTGLPYEAANNSLQQARQALQRADFAERLRENASGEEAEEARRALAGLNYENFRYRDVLTYTESVRERRRQAFSLNDRIQAARLTLQNYREAGVNTTGIPGQIREAEAAFNQGQFDTAQAEIQEAEETLNDRQASKTLGHALAEQSRSLVAENAVFFAVLAALLVAGGVIDYVVLRRKRRQRKKEKLQLEKEAVGMLMETAQKDFFVNNRISETVYTLRMDAYQDRMHQIQEELRGLEEHGEDGDTSGVREAAETLPARIEDVSS